MTISVNYSIAFDPLNFYVSMDRSLRPTARLDATTAAEIFVLFSKLISSRMYLAETWRPTRCCSCSRRPPTSPGATEDQLPPVAVAAAETETANFLRKIAADPK